MVLLAACGTTPKSGTEASAARTPSAGGPVASPPARRGGGYYLDDGPGDNPPPDLALLPDAVPRIEKYASGANRPYNVFGVDYVPDLSGAPYRQRGTGSWYGRKFHGQRTSNGEIYDMYAMTAAHPTLPIPCYALVTNLQNGRSVIVRVNDRGPFLHNRVMDLSYAAAWKLGYMSSGSGMIEVEMLMPADIAAGRIPATTTALLASASMPSSLSPSRSQIATASIAPPSGPSTAGSSSLGLQTPVPPTLPSSSPPTLTIEALTMSLPASNIESARPPLIASSGSSNASAAMSNEMKSPGQRDAAGLPPAPTVIPEAAARSLPLPTTSPREPREAADLIALPDHQPPAALPEISTAAGFYLQLGAFRVRNGADSFAAHVAREIDPAIAARVQVSEGGGLYRVRIGPYPRRGDADLAAASLRAAVAQPVLVMPGGAR